MEVAFARAFLANVGLYVPAFELASLCQKVEHRVAGENDVMTSDCILCHRFAE